MSVPESTPSNSNFLQIPLNPAQAPLAPHLKSIAPPIPPVLSPLILNHGNFHSREGTPEPASPVFKQVSKAYFEVFPKP